MQTSRIQVIKHIFQGKPHQEVARHTIGIPETNEKHSAEWPSISSWIDLIQTISAQIEPVFE